MKRTIKTYSYYYGRDIYLSARASTDPDYEEYAGYLSGIPKTAFPSVIISDIAYTYPSEAVGVPYSSVALKAGFIRVVLGNKTNGVAFAIMRFGSETNNIYNLVTFSIRDGLIDSYVLPGWSVPTNTQWNELYTQMGDYVYFVCNSNDDFAGGTETIQILNTNNSPFDTPVYSFGNIRIYSDYASIVEGDEIPGEQKPEEMDEPYGQGGYSQGSIGGEGTYDVSSDKIDFPTPPSLSAVSTGMITIYTPSLSQILALADYMWNGPFDINNFKKMFADPMDCILGLSIVPVDVPSTGSQTITIGNIVSSVTANVASTQYIWVNCGSIEIKEHWGSYLDYSPYTKIDLYLPFVGSIALNPDDVMGKVVNIRYLIDILSGSFMCFIKCGDSILYNYSGSCSSMIPITSNDWSSLYRSIMEISGLAVSGVVGGVGAVAGAIGSSGGGKSALDLVGDAFNYGKDVAVGSASAVMSSKPQIQKSGSVGGAIGHIGIKTPYLTITIPRQCLPINQNKINGYPSWTYSKLGDLTGFTVVQNMHFDNFSGLLQEKREITELLSGGVIL